MTQKEKLIELLWDNHNDHPGAFSGMTDDFEHEADYLIANGVIVRDKGEWFPIGDCANEGVYCSVCGKKVYKYDYAKSVSGNKMQSNFCPNCGADMRKEDSDA